ncbi:MAG TPA: HAMP domain-containing sensor histidine kinase [Acidimicrobiales bacterium]|nr:HAMP domain-containing sensor histidine kinase [Acidimicrobiales bacterium]
MEDAGLRDPAAAEPTALHATVSPSVRRPPRRRLGLRARVTTAFALGALVLSGALAGITFFVVRGSIVNQQLSSLRDEAFANAVLLRGELRVPTAYIHGLITTLASGPNTASFIYSKDDGGRWYPSSPTLGYKQLPSTLRSEVLAGSTVQEIPPGTTELVVGVPIPAEKADYFEVFGLADLAQTLHVLLVALIIAALVTTIAGAIVGRWAASRALRPLHETAQAALAIASGRLGTRLESADFADLAVLASAFNRMVDQLQERIEREARFSSDVNHELRSPLTTLAASLSILEARRDELPPRAIQALDLLGAEVRRFRRLVDDLLEISRFDATPGDLSRDEVTVGDLVEHAVRATGTDVPIRFAPGVASRHILVDKRRFERILANLFENAQRYAGSATLLAVEEHGSSVRFLVEDAGPGIAPEERDRIFERFSRGSTGRRRGLGDGTGLGLAIVAQHVHQHGGRVWVEGRPGGGSRFVVELPAMDEVAA